MLEELLKKEPVDVKKILSDEYGLKMSADTEKRLGEMCNLSQVLIDQGIIGLGEISGKVVARFEDGMTIEMVAEKSLRSAIVSGKCFLRLL